MPAAQVTRLPLESSCEIFLNNLEGSVALPCAMHPSKNNAIVTSCKNGLNNYTIKKGYKNMLYSIIPNITQKPSVHIGLEYQFAESLQTNTDFMTPIITSGSLSLNSLKSSSSIRLQKTTLNINMTL